MDPDLGPGAVIAVAAAAGAIGKPLAETGARLIEAVLGKPLAVAGEMLADEIYLQQTIRRLRVAARARRHFVLAGKPAGVIPPGFLTALLEGAGNADSEDLEELWAKLLFSASTDSNYANPAFVEVLRRLSPASARAFDCLARAQLLEEPVAIRSLALELKALVERAGEHRDPYLAEIAILEACGVVHYKSIVVQGRTYGPPDDPQLLDFGLTLFGELFFCALNGLDPTPFGARRTVTMSEMTLPALAVSKASS
jgi:hypothetical protein